MIILDTNVLSALMRAHLEPTVVSWLDRQSVDSVWTTSISIFESRTGLALMPVGRRRKVMEEVFRQIVEIDLEGRVLPFDAAAATQAAELAAVRQRAGRPQDVRDTQVAGIVLARQASLATRNTKHFPDLPRRVINPWTDKSA